MILRQLWWEGHINSQNATSVTIPSGAVILKLSKEVFVNTTSRIAVDVILLNIFVTLNLT